MKPPPRMGPIRVVDESALETGSLLREFYRALFDRYGPQSWWPGDSPFEVIVGAILTQGTRWSNVEKALGRLRSNGLLDPPRLSTVPPDRLAPLLRSAGYYRVKAGRLLKFMAFFRERYGLDIRRMIPVETDPLRRELLAIDGIGPETADSILLYAFQRPVFVVDAYARRVLARHGIIDEAATYSGIQRIFMCSLPANPGLFNEYHALLVRVGKNHCRSRPLCDGCPLEPFLDHEVAGSNGRGRCR